MGGKESSLVGTQSYLVGAQSTASRLNRRKLKYTSYIGLSINGSKGKEKERNGGESEGRTHTVWCMCVVFVGTQYCDCNPRCLSRFHFLGVNERTGQLWPLYLIFFLGAIARVRKKGRGGSEIASAGKTLCRRSRVWTRWLLTVCVLHKKWLKGQTVPHKDFLGAIEKGGRDELVFRLPYTLKEELMEDVNGVQK